MAKALLFDLDGVVTDTAELHYQAWQELADRHDIPFDRDSNEALRGLSREDSLLALLDGRGCADEEFRAMLDAKNQRYLQLLEGLTPEDVLPGIDALLDELSSQGVPIAIASSSRNARAIVGRLDLERHFSVVSDGNSVRRSKPAPDVFVHAAGQLAANCDDCIVLEDAAAGIIGARTAGMRTVGVGAHVADAGPDLLVATTAEITSRSLAPLMEH